jgi:hypothetical protein
MRLADHLSPRGKSRSKSKHKHLCSPPTLPKSKSKHKHLCSSPTLPKSKSNHKPLRSPPTSPSFLDDHLLPKLAMYHGHTAFTLHISKATKLIFFAFGSRCSATTSIRPRSLWRSYAASLRRRHRQATHDVGFIGVTFTLITTSPVVNREYGTRQSAMHSSAPSCFLNFTSKARPACKFPQRRRPRLRKV